MALAALGALLGCAAPLGAAAAPTYLSCADVNNNRAYYIIDAEAGTLRAYDDSYRFRYAIPVQTSEVFYSWRIPGQDTDAGMINRITLEFSLHTRPGGWMFWVDKRWVYEGPCQILDSLPLPKI